MTLYPRLGGIQGQEKEMELKTEGRRTYILGNTYPVRERIRAIGAKWDPARKAWWTSKRHDAERLVNEINGEIESAKPTAEDELFAQAYMCNMGTKLSNLLGPKSKACFVEYRDGFHEHRWEIECISENTLRVTAIGPKYSWLGKTWIVKVSPGQWFQPVDRGGYIDHEDMLSYGYDGYANARPDREGRVYVEGSGEKEPERRRLYIKAVKAVSHEDNR